VSGYLLIRFETNLSGTTSDLSGEAKEIQKEFCGEYKDNSKIACCDQQKISVQRILESENKPLSG